MTAFAGDGERAAGVGLLAAAVDRVVGRGNPAGSVAGREGHQDGAAEPTVSCCARKTIRRGRRRGVVVKRRRQPGGLHVAGLVGGLGVDLVRAVGREVAAGERQAPGGRFRPRVRHDGREEVLGAAGKGGTIPVLVRGDVQDADLLLLDSGGAVAGRAGDRARPAAGVVAAPRRRKAESRGGRRSRIDLCAGLSRGGRRLDVAGIVRRHTVETVRVAVLTDKRRRGQRGVLQPRRVRTAVVRDIYRIVADARAIARVAAGPGDGERGGIHVGRQGRDRAGQSGARVHRVEDLRRAQRRLVVERDGGLGGDHGPRCVGRGRIDRVGDEAHANVTGGVRRRKAVPRAAGRWLD